MVTKTVGDLQSLLGPAIDALSKSTDPRAASILAAIEYAWEPYQGMDVTAVTPARDLGPETRGELCKALTAAYDLTRAPQIDGAAMVILGISPDLRREASPPIISFSPFGWVAIGAVGILALLAIYKVATISRT